MLCGKRENRAIKQEKTMRLQGKTAIVTGAGSGFGAGIARKFAAEGAQVLLADINKDAAEAIAKEINGVASATDVSTGESVKAMIDLALEKFGQIDIVVNNAGVTHLPAPLDTISESPTNVTWNVGNSWSYVWITAGSLQYCQR